MQLYGFFWKDKENGNESLWGRELGERGQEKKMTFSAVHLLGQLLSFVFCFLVVHHKHVLP